jgi:hypothetical protein
MALMPNQMPRHETAMPKTGMLKPITPATIEQIAQNRPGRGVGLLGAGGAAASGSPVSGGFV